LAHILVVIFSNQFFLRLRAVDEAGYPKIFMIALWNRADHYIFALRFLLSSPSFFFSFLA